MWTIFILNFELQIQILIKCRPTNICKYIYCPPELVQFVPSFIDQCKNKNSTRLVARDKDIKVSGLDTQ